MAAKKTKKKPAKKSLRKVAVAGMIGNGLEWYDYALYGNFAPILSQLFFPNDNKYVSLLLTYGVFAAGFIMRPVGAVIFGYIGDRYGRKISLAVSILLMAIPTSFIGLLPTYAQIGIAAPILLTLIRLLQGAALGGEFSGSITYIVEHSMPKNRNFAGSLSVVSLVMGMLLGSAVASLFANILSKEDLYSWGWRVPFIIGFFIGIIGLYIRSFLSESPEYENAKEFNQLADKPVSELFRNNFGGIILATGLYMAVTIPFYTLSVFMNTYLSRFLNFPLSDALILTTIGMLVMLVIVPLSAILADKYGNRPVLLISVVMLCLIAVPVFWLIAQGVFALALVGVIFFATVLGFYIAPIPTVLVDIFPTRVRYTGMAVACNLCAALFGGTTPYVATKLLQQTGDNLVIAYYIIASALISLVAIGFMKRARA